MLIVRYESSEVKLGGAGNAAANLKALGAQVTALGYVGNDEMGGHLRSSCREAGIELLSPESSLPTETKTRILAGGHNTRRQQMLRLDRGCEGAYPASLENELAAMVREYARQAESILISDYGSGVLGKPVIAEILTIAKEGIPVCVDSRYQLGEFAGATILKPNEPELAALAGVRADTEERFTQAIQVVQSRMNGQSMVVTRGRYGMAVVENGEIEFIPAHGDQEAVDVTGAGDTVGATLALALSAGADLSSAAQLANIAGALQVLKSGTATVFYQELKEELG